jgi:hypothetical protein
MEQELQQPRNASSVHKHYASDTRTHQSRKDAGEKSTHRHAGKTILLTRIQLSKHPDLNSHRTKIPESTQGICGDEFGTR